MLRSVVLLKQSSSCFGALRLRRTAKWIASQSHHSRKGADLELRRQKTPTKETGKANGPARIAGKFSRLFAFRFVLRGYHYTAKAEMVGAGAGFALAARVHNVARAVLIRA